MKTWILAAAALSLLAATGCKKKTPTTTGEAGPAVTPVAEAVTQPSGEEVRTGLPDPQDQMLSLATIYFDFDAATLSDEAKTTLKRNAEALLGNVAVTVRVEGHADERGSTQYNLALGERRANAVKTYFTSLGIAASRLELVSYGEEKPAVAGHDDATWAKNRRVELSVTAGADRVSSSY